MPEGKGRKTGEEAEPWEEEEERRGKVVSFSPLQTNEMGGREGGGRQL